MNEQCIINVGIGHWYPVGTQRLLDSLAKFPTRADMLIWCDGMPPGSPEHQEHPYAFKPYAFEAARQAGYRYVLWCDSSIFAVKDPQPVFDAIRRDGYYFTPVGWVCGQWMTDKSLDLMGLSRDEAMLMPDFTGSCMGLDMQHRETIRWFDSWLHHATSGAFIGDWRNDQQQCSEDPRCLGHRHDQVIGSVLFNQMGFKFNDEDFFQYPPQGWPDCSEQLRPSVIFANQGM